jgi:predicted protein tyrosine phosphatase
MKIVSHSQANKLVQRENHNKTGEIKSLVSIYSPPESIVAAFLQGDTKPCSGFVHFRGPKLALAFDDTSNPDSKEIMPTKDHIKRLINWAQQVNSIDGMLIHCHAGISRSTAAGVIVLCTLDTNPVKAIECVQSIRPQLFPNSLMIEYADEILSGMDKFMREELNAALKDWDSKQEGIIIV